MDYDALLTFLKNTPANLFFKDADCRYLFLSDVGHLSPQKKERRDDILGKTDLEIWSDPERGRFYYEQDRKILATGQGIEYISEVPRDDGPGYFQIKKNPVRMDGDEFAMVCSHCSAQQAEALIAKIQAELARKSDDRLRLDMAFGYHTVTEGPFDYTDAYHKADRDMYRNKQLNR